MQSGNDPDKVTKRRVSVRLPGTPVSQLESMHTPSASITQNSATMIAILDATEDILRNEGYAAVSSRKIAQKAGLKSQLVHYYFKTMDDLFLALYSRVEERHFHGLTTALASRTPLRDMWELSIATHSPRLHKEFVALSTHRERLRSAIARSAERTRSITSAVISRALDEHGLDHDAWPPIALSIMMEGVARLVVSEFSLGTEMGHAETIRFVGQLLDKLEKRESGLLG